MLETAENLRKQYGIPRQVQDEYSLRSHQRAVAAWDAGKFDDELVPVTVTTRQGEVVVDRDEHPRADTIAGAPGPAAGRDGRQDPEATVTAGNASGENDAAACCIVTTPERAAELGLKPMAKFLGWAVNGVHPAYMGIGPVPATKKLLDRLGMQMSDIDLIELNEAFAVQVLPCAAGVGLRRRRLRPAQRQRLRHLDRSPDRRDRRPYHGDAAARDAAPRRPHRPRDDVHRRRPGHRGGL